MQTFTQGQELKSRSICNSDCVFTATVTRRTGKTVTIKVDDTEKRCKIYQGDNGEYIYPFGRYSMAPIFRA